MAADLDLRFQTVLANDLPSFVAQPHRRRSSAPPRWRTGWPTCAGLAKFDVGATTPSWPPRETAAIRCSGVAPDFAGNGPWLNTPGGRPLTLSGLRGRVVLVDFWTYTCINCLRTLPHLRAWDGPLREAAGSRSWGCTRRSSPSRRTPATSGGRSPATGCRYPVLQDNDYDTWTAWGNQFWPAKYLIDGRGRVRYTHFGEGEYDATERAIRTLLARGRPRVRWAATRGPAARWPPPAPPRRRPISATTRAQGFVPAPPHGRRRTATRRARLTAGQSRFALGGALEGGRESATAVSDATLDARFNARRVFLVLSSRGDRPRVGARPAGRPPGRRRARRVRTCAAGRSGSPASGSTGSSRCRAWRTGRSAWSCRPESRATRSRSGSLAAWPKSA